MMHFTLTVQQRMNLVAALEKVNGEATVAISGPTNEDNDAAIVVMDSKCNDSCILLGEDQIDWGN
jgi:hypothetical protein